MSGSFGKILVVDDHESARQLILRTLKALGYSNITEAVSGEDAEAALREGTGKHEPFDLVFSDIHMAGITGLELLRRCGSDPAICGGAKFVMVTAEVELHCITEALKLGALDYIKKPVNASDLKRKIEGIARRIQENAA